MLFHLMMVGDDVFGYKSVELYEPGMKWWDAYEIGRASCRERV